MIQSLRLSPEKRSRLPAAIGRPGELPLALILGMPPGKVLCQSFIAFEWHRPFRRAAPIPGIFAG
jgi:hypothetical protein